MTDHLLGTPLVDDGEPPTAGAVSIVFLISPGRRGAAGAHLGDAGSGQAISQVGRLAGREHEVGEGIARRRAQ